MKVFPKSELNPTIPRLDCAQRGSVKNGRCRLPNSILAPICLFLRPKEFFQNYIHKTTPLYSIIAFWVTGVVFFALSIEQKIDHLNQKGPWLSATEHWDVFWITCIWLGAFVGLMFFMLGVWWYRKRLEFSGAKEPDAILARRVYVYAFLVYGIPVSLFLVWQTVHYSSPVEATHNANWYGLILYLFLLWATVTSYYGASTVFSLRRVPALVWFLILPLAVYGLFFGGSIVATVMKTQNPVIDRPLSVNRPAYKFDYPRNWIVDRSDTDSDCDKHIQIEPPYIDAMAQFHLDEESGLSKSWADDFKNALQGEVLQSQQVEKWGNYSGYGYKLSIKSGSNTFEGVIFTSSSDQASFLVFEVCPSALCERLKPGFDLIRQSFALKQAELAGSSAGM